MATVWWSDESSFMLDLNNADDEHLRVMCDWARGREQASEEARSAKSRRHFRHMRVAAEQRMMERGLSADAPGLEEDAATEPTASTTTDEAGPDNARSRIMYIEAKAGALTGAARIGRVRFSKTMKRIYYRDQIFQRLPYPGFKSNHYDVASGDDYWISGPKQAGGDRLYGERVAVEIDDDVRVEYWTEIRNQPHRVDETDASR